jgi:hypothetical protein
LVVLGARLADESVRLRVVAWGALDPTLLVGEHALMSWRAVSSGRETFPAECTWCDSIKVVDTFFTIPVVTNTIILISV